MAIRNSRFSAVVPEAALDKPCVVVGVGSVGHNLVRLLAQLGASRVTIVDPDKVSPENIGPQGYRSDDVGRAKVDCAKETYDGIFPEGQCQVVWDVFNEAVPDGDILFLCVDNIPARKSIALARDWPVIIDVRVGGYSARQVTSQSVAEYVATLPEPGEESPDPCGNRMNPFTACIAACMQASEFCRYLRGGEFPGRDIVFSAIDMSSQPFSSDEALALLGEDD